MTHRFHDGFGYIPVSAGGALQAFLEAYGYYYRRTSDAPTGMSLVAPGRFGRGRKLALTKRVNVGDELNQIVRPLGLHYTTGFLGCFVNIGATNLSNVFVGAHDAVNDVRILTASFHPNGVVKLHRGSSSGPVLGTSEAGAYKKETDFWLEVGLSIDAIAATPQVRINTKPVISLVAQNTLPGGTVGAYADSYIFGSENNFQIPTEYAIGDFYFNDDQGAGNNTFQGNVQPRTMVMVGPGPHTGMAIDGTAPPATNWQAASNQNLTDAAYVKSPNSGDYDLYALDPILGNQPVHALKLLAAWRQDDATQQNGHLLLKAGATLFEGGDHFVNQTYAGDFDIVELNPDTGLGMTGAQVNAMYAGPKNAT